MRARSLRMLSITAIAAMTLSGCMGRGTPVAYAPPPGYAPPAYSPAPPPPPYAAAPAPSRADLDRMAYGRPAPAPVVVAPTPVAAYAAVPVVQETAYRLDAGDRLRVVVYGQEGLTNTYAVDAGGNITMPLIGAVQARGLTPSGLAKAITSRLRNGFIREPYVAAEIETYRPFFILGEVAAPGQYPYVPNMTVESAVAIAGGFSPRAQRGGARLTRSNEAGSVRSNVPLETPLNPGDTVVIGERWF